MSAAYLLVVFTLELRGTELASVWNVAMACGRRRGNVLEQMLLKLLPRSGTSYLHLRSLAKTSHMGKSDISGARRENASLHPRDGQLIFGPIIQAPTLPYTEERGDLAAQASDGVNASCCDKERRTVLW